MKAYHRVALTCALVLACAPARVQAQQTAKPTPGQTAARAVSIPPVDIVQTPAPRPKPQAHAGHTTQAGSPEPAFTPAPAETSLPAMATPVGATATLRHFTAERARTSDTAGLIGRLPGGATYAGGGVSGLPVLDGFADDRLHVEIAGMGLMSACGNHMNPPMSYVAPSQIGEVTVYSNLVPVSVGGDSTGGAILVNPPPPAFAGPQQALTSHASVGSYYRSNGDGFGGNAYASVGTQNVSVTYNGAYAKSGNYDAGGDFHMAGPAFDRVMGAPPTKVPYLQADEVGSTAYEAINNNVSLAARNGNHLFQADIGFQHIPEQLYPNERMDMTDNKSFQGDLRYTGDYAWGVLKAEAYYQRVRHEMNFGEDKQFYYGGMPMPMTGMMGGMGGMMGGMGMSSEIAPGMPMDTRAFTTGAKLAGDIDISNRDVLRLGAEYQHFDYNDWWPPSPPGGTGMMAPNTFESINDGRRDRADAFAEWQRTWSPAWTTQIGVRSDTVFMDTGEVHGYNTADYNAAPLFPATTFNQADRSKTDQNWDVTAQAIYTANDNATYSFGYSQKARSPNLYERYAWSTNTMAAEMLGWFGDGNFYIGNLNLDPEIAHTLSATADLHNDSGSAGMEITPYYSHVSNYIGVRRCPTSVCGTSPAVIDSLTAKQGFVFLQFDNQDADLFGTDISGHMLLAQDTRFGSFTARGVVSYVYGTTGDGDHLYHLMPINGRIALEQTVGRWTNVIETQLVGEKNEVSQVHNEVKTGAYALLNLRSSYEWRNLRLDFGVDNVFDTLYDLPLGGLYLGQGATMSSTGVPWGVALPGMGRSFYVATNVSF